jgi:hypothetical protein
MSTTDTIKILDVTMTLQAARLVEWTSADVAADVRRVRAEGCDGLLADCLDGCDSEGDAEGWRDYVSAICAAAEADERAEAEQDAPEAEDNDPDSEPHNVALSNGRELRFSNRAEAECWIRAEWPDCELGHDGDLDDGGNRTLVWSCEADSIDDDGACSVARLYRAWGAS